MVFTAPAVHYSALATLPPELTSSKSQQSIKYTNNNNNIRFKLNQIFKKFLYNHIHNEQIITNEINNEHIQLPKTILHLTETIEKENQNKTSIIIKNPNNNNSGKQTSISNLIQPLERLPFTEPYFSISSKIEKFPFQLSNYHKHCIHQQKYINQKQYHHESSSSIKEHHSNSRLKNLIDQDNKTNVNNKKTISTTTLPISSSSSIGNHIGLKYASRKAHISNNHNIYSSNTQHLRRLHSKTKLHTISNEKKSIPLSSSIAQRIELLKQAMHNNQLEFYHSKSEKIISSNSLINKQTQTNNQLKSSEIHYIHHHHIHSSSLLSSIQWRTYLSIIGVLIIIFLIPLTTISF